tara:strand:+ start:91 stop:720 length:630 start_codon:yes stop_codon:yes gene_type:complete
MDFSNHLYTRNPFIPSFQYNGGWPFYPKPYNPHTTGFQVSCNARHAFRNISSLIKLPYTHPELIFLKVPNDLIKNRCGGTFATNVTSRYPSNTMTPPSHVIRYQSNTMTPPSHVIRYQSLPLTATPPLGPKKQPFHAQVPASSGPSDRKGKSSPENTTLTSPPHSESSSRTKLASSEKSSATQIGSQMPTPPSCIITPRELLEETSSAL